MSKKESRLQFTDKERSDPYLGESVRKAEKAAEKADKAQQKIPKKKVVKSELIADNSNGKIKVKLHFEDAEKKPPSKLNVASQEATKTAMQRRMQKELRQDEDDNAGIDAADAGIEAAESASQTFREVRRSVRMKPYRDAEKAERKLENANIEYFQKKAEIENPTSNPFSKWRQKQEIKRQYAAAKAGHTVSGSTAAARNTAKAAKKAVKNTEESASFVVRHKKGIAIILGFLLMLSFLLNAIPMFKVVSVFDVSQTEGKPLPQLAYSLSGAVEHYEEFMEALKRTSTVPIKVEHTEKNVDGFFDLTNQSITIQAGMSEIQTVCAVIHEIAHSRLHNYDHMTELADDGETLLAPAEKDRHTEEVEAESISYAVCQYFGIETSENSFGYIASWSQGKELKELRASLETINRTSSELISSIEKHFQEICKEKGIGLSTEQKEATPAQSKEETHFFFP